MALCVAVVVQKKVVFGTFHEKPALSTVAGVERLAITVPTPDRVAETARKLCSGELIHAA